MMQFTLTEPVLGTLDLTDSDYVVVSYDLGFPAVREVVYDRSYGSGVVDQTSRHSSRPVTLDIILNGNAGSNAQLRDRLAGYLDPSRRPVLTFVEPSDGRVRRMVLRGSNTGVPISNRKFNRMAVSWVCPDGVIESAEEHSLSLRPADPSVEVGRTYPLSWPRDYPPGVTAGASVIHNAGNRDAEWTAELFGPMTSPSLSLGPSTIDFTANGGLVLLAGQSVTIDSRGHIVLFDGNLATPALQFVDYLGSDWWTIPPGDSFIRLDAVTYTTQSAATVRWRDTWL